MVAVVGGSKVFVAHRATGVRLIPAEWLDAWRPSGFREATPTEVLEWYEERETDPPADVLRAVSAGSSAAGEDEVRGRPITLRAESLPDTPGVAVPPPPAALPTLRALL